VHPGRQTGAAAVVQMLIGVHVRSSVPERAIVSPYLPARMFFSFTRPAESATRRMSGTAFWYYQNIAGYTAWLSLNGPQKRLTRSGKPSPPRCTIV
jgi:hypothetical protein